MAKFDSASFLRHLQQKWGGRGCGQCGKPAWQVQDSTFELREFQGGNMIMGGPVIPIVPVTCANCGNTILVNALVAGAMKREPESKP